MSTPPREPTEQELEEMRAAYEAELKRITAADVVIQTAVTLINLAGRRLGLAPDSGDERDLEQVRDAIDAVRGLMPVLERRAPNDLGQLRGALSQLQMAYATEAGATGPSPAGAGPAAGAAGATTPTGGGGAAGSAGPAEPASGTSGPPGEPGPGAASSPADPDRPGPGPAESSGRLWVPGR